MTFVKANYNSADCRIPAGPAYLHCVYVVPENLHTPSPPQKGFEIPGGWGVSKTENLKEMYKV